MNEDNVGPAACVVVGPGRNKSATIPGERNRMKHITSLVFGLLLVATSFGQKSFTIADPSIVTCQASFLDTGGESQSPYGDNESFTTTICPTTQGQGDAISLQFVAFSLSTAGTSPIDQMSIYDGSDTNAPLIGTWTGNNSPGIISASFGNPTGCLTVVWSSNETGTGDFAAYITCYQPCEPPLAAATLTNEPIQPALVCQSETITFDATTSTAAAGFNIVEYKWDFADGVVDSLSGPVVSHSFPEPGEYIVQVYLTDDNECASTNLVDLRVWVSTTPDFSATNIADTTICQGQSAVLDATGVVPVTWSAIPAADFGDGIYLPDDQSAGFSSPLTFTQLEPGAVLTDISDLVSVCVSMEHSFMGDLVINLTCPNGQTVIFHQQGGGGTFLGNALDGETEPPTPGECWDYCWSPSATNGTWADNAGVSPLPSGTYESLFPMSQLVGCPLNGTWTINVADLWGADDGFICAWHIEFAPELYPDLTSYTPDLGTASMDSSWWEGPAVITDPNTPLVAYMNGTTPGTFTYTFHVTDNFGCVYDSSMTVTVTPSPQGPIIITGDSMVCGTDLAQLDAPAGYDTYVWLPGNMGTPSVEVGPGSYTVTVAYGSCPLTSDPFEVGIAPDPEPVITGPQLSCGGEPVVLSTTEPFAFYTWSNESSDPTISVGSGSYTVTVTSAEGCTSTSDPYAVVVASDPNAAFTTNPVSPQPMGTSVLFADQSTVQGSTIVDWDWTFGDLGTSTDQSPTWPFADPGDYEVTLVVTTAEGCTDSVSAIYIIFPPDITIPNVISPNGDDQNDYFVIRNIEFWSNQLTIYGRWGNKVYEAKNYVSQWKADGLPDGTYYYVLTLNDGKEHAGHITVLR